MHQLGHCKPFKVNKPVQTEWRIHTVNYTIIGSDNDLASVGHQAIIGTNAGLLLSGPLEASW